MPFTIDAKILSLSPHAWSSRTSSCGPWCHRPSAPRITAWRRARGSRASPATRRTGRCSVLRSTKKITKSTDDAEEWLIVHSKKTKRGGEVWFFHNNISAFCLLASQSDRECSFLHSKIYGFMYISHNSANLLLSWCGRALVRSLYLYTWCSHLKTSSPSNKHLSKIKTCAWHLYHRYDQTIHTTWFSCR